MKWVRRDAMGPAVAGVAVLAGGLATAAGWVDWLGVGRWLQARAGVAAAVVVGGVLLALAARRQWPRASPRASRTLSWSVVAVGGALVAAVTWGATAWLLQQAERAQDPAAARVEAVKTGLGIGAGTGGVFALLLAVRRQWHQEHAVAGTTHDATERRVTELYTKAADQLGSDKPAVRLAGLYALERVAQDNATQRQTVVNVLAAYLRMPFDPPDTLPSDHYALLPADGAADAETSADMDMDQIRREYRERIQELEVRLAAQRILAKHLQSGPPRNAPVDTFWTNIELDLTGAALVRWDLSKGIVRTATFERATFTGFTRFDGAWFADTARFDGAEFAGTAKFDGARFADTARFDGAEFAGTAKFNSAQFDGIATFNSAQFRNLAHFDSVQFDGTAEFDSARFDGTAKFNSAWFGAPVKFRRVRFAGSAQFGSMQFSRPARFGSNVQFNDAWFGGFAQFHMVRFDDWAKFDSAQFDRSARFDGAQFTEEVPPEVIAFMDPVARSGADDIEPTG